jgi:hypothetical protein
LLQTRVFHWWREQNIVLRCRVRSCKVHGHPSISQQQSKQPCHFLLHNDLSTSITLRISSQVIRTLHRGCLFFIEPEVACLKDVQVFEIALAHFLNWLPRECFNHRQFIGALTRSRRSVLFGCFYKSLKIEFKSFPPKSTQSVTIPRNISKETRNLEAKRSKKTTKLSEKLPLKNGWVKSSRAAKANTVAP